VVPNSRRRAFSSLASTGIRVLLGSVAFVESSCPRIPADSLTVGQREFRYCAVRPYHQIPAAALVELRAPAENHSAEDSRHHVEILSVAQAPAACAASWPDAVKQTPGCLAPVAHEAIANQTTR
jgi:hypothetical protein